MKPFLPTCRIAAASLIMAATLQAQAESMQIGCYLFEYTKSGATIKSADGSLIEGSKAVIPATINVDGMRVPVTGIASTALSKVEQLDSLIIEDSDRPLEMGGYALDDAAYHYYIGRNLEEEPERPSFFRGSAVSIEFGDKVTSLEGFGSSYFYGSDNLEKVVIGSGLKRIPDQCFRDCSNLSELTLAEGVESLGSYILYDSPLVTTLRVPSTVTSVSGYFISRCNVGEVWFTSAVPPAGLESFDSRKSATIYVPMEGYQAYHNALRNNKEVTLYAVNTDDEIVATHISISDFQGEYLHQGDVVTLSATVEPQIATDKNVTWTSSDPSVATVDDNGTVTAVAPGFVEITATLACGATSTTSRVEVLAPGVPELPLIGEFNLYPETFVTAWGDVEMYCKDVDYTQWRDRFEWTSSDESVMKIVDYNAGKATVRPMAPGEAEITIRSIDQPEKSASAIWKVYAPDITVSEIPAEIFTNDEFQLQIHTNAIDSVYKLGQTFQNYEISKRMMESKVDLTFSDNSLLQRIDHGGNDYESRFFPRFKAIKAGQTVMTIRMPEFEKELQLPITVKPRTLSDFSISFDKCSTHIIGVEHTASITEYPYGSNATYRWSVASPDSVRLLDTHGSTVRFIPLLEGSISIKAECVENPAISKVAWIHSAHPIIGIKGNTQFEAGDTDFGYITGNFWECAEVFTEGGTEYPVILENSNPDVIKLEGVEQNRFYNLSALRPGRATITARLRGTDAVASMEVRVGGTEVYSLDLAVLVRPGASVMLDASCNPTDAYDRSVTWRSSDETVATVADGIVTGINAGRATITARSNDNPDVTALIPVRVVPSALTGFSIMPTAIQATPGERVEITPTFTPAEGRQPIEWSSSDWSVASVDRGIVTIESEGTCVITATPADNPELKAECTVSVTASVESYFESPDTEADIYNLAGYAVLRNATREYAMRLTPGIYIINGRPYYKH